MSVSGCVRTQVPRSWWSKGCAVPQGTGVTDHLVWGLGSKLGSFVRVVLTQPMSHFSSPQTLQHLCELTLNSDCKAHHLRTAVWVSS